MKLLRKILFNPEYSKFELNKTIRNQFALFLNLVVYLFILFNLYAIIVYLPQNYPLLNDTHLLTDLFLICTYILLLYLFNKSFMQYASDTLILFSAFLEGSKIVENQFQSNFRLSGSIITKNLILKRVIILISLIILFLFLPIFLFSLIFSTEIFYFSYINVSNFLKSVNELLIIFPYIDHSSSDERLTLITIFAILYSTIIYFVYYKLFGFKIVEKSIEKDKESLIEKINSEINEKISYFWKGSIFTRDNWSITEDLSLDITINIKDSFTLRKILFQSNLLTEVKKNNEKEIIQLENGDSFNKEFYLQSKNSGLAKFFIAIEGERKEISFFDEEIFDLFCIKNPIITLFSHKILIKPLQPELEVQIEIKCSENCSIEFILYNKGMGISKNISISHNVPKELILQKLNSIETISPNNKKNSVLIFKNRIKKEESLVFKIKYHDKDEISSEDYEIILDTKKYFLPEESKPEIILLKPIKYNKIYSSFLPKLLKEIQQEFRQNDLDFENFYNSISHPLLIEIVNFKRIIEKNLWKKTKKFTLESQFRDILFNYLNEEGKFISLVTSEYNIGGNRVDILIQNKNGLEKIPLEIKRITKIKSIIEHEKSLNRQIREYCSLLEENFGFLIIFENVSQGEDPYPPMDLDFAITTYPSSKGTKSYKIVIITILIRSGERTAPSLLSK